jgi:hypothetical protein
MRRAGAALVVTAAVALGGLALAAPAQATLERSVYVPDPPRANQMWGRAWNECRKQYPDTHSVHWFSSTPHGPYWQCYVSR